MQTTIDPTAFRARYGPWAVICGASDGSGAAFARQLAALGLNLVLIARRPELLAQLAAELERAHGVSTRSASIDLYEADAGTRVAAAAAGLEVGLYVSNAGADTSHSQFIDAPLDTWRRLVRRNVLAVMESVHEFAGPMCQRGRGGILLMSSGVALGGMPGAAVYSATKAFDLNLAESLWAELAPRGVDVLSGVCPPMDTPSHQRLLSELGLAVPGQYAAEEVAGTLLARLGDGPLQMFGFGPDAAEAPRVEKARRERVLAMVEMAKMFFGSR